MQIIFNQIIILMDYFPNKNLTFIKNKHIKIT